MEEPLENLSDDAYVEWLVRRIGEELMRLRVDGKQSAYGMAENVKLTNQALRNMERAKNKRGCCIGSLARVLRHHRVDLAQFFTDLLKPPH